MAKRSKGPAKTGRAGRADGPTEPAVDSGYHLGGFLGKLGDLMGKLGELAEAGQQFSQSGQFADPAGKFRGVYGFSVKTGLGDHGQPEFKVEPFGNIPRRATGDEVLDPLREPLVDVHEEDDHLLVLAEIPGVSKKDVELNLCGDRLTISARRGQARYRKQVVLPQEFSAEKMRWACKNGILSIRLER